MNSNNLAKQKARVARLPLVEKLVLRGYTYRAIQKEVRENFPEQALYSLPTVKKDIEIIKAEWAKETKADREEVLRNQIKTAQDRNTALWELYKKTENPACLAEIRHNEEHIADLLQLGKQDKTNIYNHTSNYIISSQKTAENMAEVKKRGG